MVPDPTITTTCDYLLELTDDGTQANPSEPEIILLPPPPGGDDSPRPPDTTAEQGPQP